MFDESDSDEDDAANTAEGPSEVATEFRKLTAVTEGDEEMETEDKDPSDLPKEDEPMADLSYTDIYTVERLLEFLDLNGNSGIDKILSFEISEHLSI